MNFRLIVFSLVVLCTFQTGSKVTAELKVPSFVSDNMVLQRDKPVALWGWADPNAKVVVAFGGQTANGTANETGRWQIELTAMPANATGRSLVIESGTDRIEIKNILVGEVWFAGGQSNMAFILSRSLEAETEVAAANHPGIRMFLAANTPAASPQDDIRGSWHLTTPETAGAFSAVAYFFAKRIHEETGVPVGIIKSCWGGKRSEAYTSREAMLSNEHGKKMIAELDQLASEYNVEKENAAYQKALAKWEAKRDEVRAFNKGKDETDRKKFPRQPKKSKPVYENERNPTVLYNGMIHPFVGYTMRGAIWYQGEANAKPELAELYLDMFTLMIQDWRTRWNDDFDFYFVQLANFQQATTEPGVESDWATVQDFQRQTLGLKGTGMATINDVGMAKDIHPKDKKTVGNRLALWALKNHHEKQIVVSGPLYKSHSIDGNKLIIEFDHVGGGLKARDDKPLQRFEISGDGDSWHWATATIVGNKIELTSPEVAKPLKARYAWAANPVGANLINKEGLPASIFQTN